MESTAAAKRTGFQSTPPVWGATAMCKTGSYTETGFQSTPPVWGATAGTPGVGGEGGISIHAPRVGGDGGIGDDKIFQLLISIHAPRVGGDLYHLTKSFEGPSNFNPRPPCGGRLGLFLDCLPKCHFNPRPPCGGRRRSARIWQMGIRYFNPRPPCGGRRPIWISRPSTTGISIHAPRVGGDGSSRSSL